MGQVTRMLATSHQMVTFSSHGDNIWCVQPEDTTSVGQPRFHVPDGNSQMVSTNDMVEETWHNINIIVSWITRFKSYVAKFDRIMYVSSRVSAKTWPPPGTTITWGHRIRTLSPWRLEYHSTIPGGGSYLCQVTPRHWLFQTIRGWVQNYFSQNTSRIFSWARNRVGVYERTVKWKIQR